MQKVNRVPVLLGLGGNKSFNGLTAERLLDAAAEDIKAILKDVSVSKYFKTKAMYYTEQADFYNAVLLGYVVTDNVESYAWGLLRDIHFIESKYGRDRVNEIRNGPRTLDIDIEAIGTLNMAEKTLTIPHERIFERLFVLEPLLDLLRKVDIPNKENYIKDVSRLIESVKNGELSK